jgi:hypothetical protein
MNKLVLLSLIFSLVFTQVAFADSLQFDFSGTVATSDIEDQLQTPAGGQPNRSDLARPTFAELGIDHLTSFALEVGVRKGKHRIFLAAHAIRKSEHTVLPMDLLSQWQQFSAGDAVDTNIQLDWHQLGYLRRFQVSDRLTYDLGADVTLFAFHYQLTNGTLQVDRRYNKGGYRLGGAINYSLTPQLTLNASAFVPFQNGGAAEITTIDITGSYKISDSLNTTLGVSFHDIDFKDGQTFPNHIVARMEPRFSIGVSFHSNE